MPYDETLAERVRKKISRWKGLSEKKMFGGVGFLLNGNMCVGVWKEFLILRVGEEKADALLQRKTCRPFDITGKVMKGWVMVEPAGIRSDKHLAPLLGTARDFVRKLPPK